MQIHFGCAPSILKQRSFRFDVAHQNEAVLALTHNNTDSLSLKRHEKLRVVRCCLSLDGRTTESVVD